MLISQESKTEMVYAIFNFQVLNKSTTREVVTMTGEGVHILTYTRHSWPLSGECSLTCHTLCNKEYPFILVIFKDLWHSNALTLAVTICFTSWVYRSWDSNTQPSACTTNALHACATAVATMQLKKIIRTFFKARKFETASTLV